MVNWGIAGCGWVARDYVAPAIRASSNGRLVALHDPNLAGMDAIEAPGAVAHTDLQAFVRTPGLDAVYIAAPNHVHRPLVEAAAAAGLHVLCEKPMATTLADAEAMVHACIRAGVRYGTAFDQRFHAAHQTLAGVIAAGRLGTVTAIRIVYACWLPSDWAPTAESGADNWRIDPRRAGGGALMDLAPHGLDLCAFLLGEPLIEVLAMGQARVQSYAVEDGALLMARTRSGVLAQLHVAYNCPDALPRRRLEIVGTAGQVVAIDTMGQTPGGTLTFIDAQSGLATPIPVPGADRSPFLNQVEAFADALSGADTFPFQGDADLHTMALVLRAQAMALPPEVLHAA